MGIPSYKYLNWQNKRLYGMVLFEDIPQIIIQIMYVFVTELEISSITCMFSNVLSVCFQKHMHAHFEIY